MFTSVFGASLACQNVATRMWYGMGRSGVLPAAFGRVHPVRKTPTLAVTAQLVISVVLGLPLVFWLGAAEIFNLTLGFVLVIAVIFIYVVANLGVVRYYWREERANFNWLLHFVFPIGTSAILIYSLYKSFSPAPARPYNWSPVIVAVWLLVGIGVLGYLRLRGSEDWLAKASAVVDDSVDLETGRQPARLTRSKERHMTDQDAARPGTVVRSYATSFERDEDPISEGGMWINGRADGIDWIDIISGNGVGYGAVSRMGAAERRGEQGNLDARTTRRPRATTTTRPACSRATGAPTSTPRAWCSAGTRPRTTSRRSSSGCAAPSRRTRAPATRSSGAA